MTGRPSKRTPEVIARIIEGLSKGTPLTVICSADDMPSDDSVRNWADADPDLSRAIARAREAGFDAIALEALDIADETTRDTKKGANGDDICNSEWISRSRLRVETRLKLLAKWDPKRYGDKVALTGGNEDDPPIKSELTVKFV